MKDTPKSLHLQVLTIPPSGSPRDQTNSIERLCRDFARIKSLPKKLLSVAIIVNFSFAFIAIFTAIFSRPTFSAYSKSFCTVWDASTQGDKWIRDSWWLIAFAHPFRTSRSRSMQDLWKFIHDLLISLVPEWGFANTLSSNSNSQWAIIWLVSTQRSTVLGVVLYHVIPTWDFWCLFIVCSIVWSDATRLKQPPCLLTAKFHFLKKKH